MSLVLMAIQNGLNALRYTENRLIFIDSVLLYD